MWCCLCSLLNGNKLSGSLPAELGYLSNLNRLQIDQNNISGTIPESFSNLNSVRHMWVGFKLNFMKAWQGLLVWFFPSSLLMSMHATFAATWTITLLVVKFLLNFPTYPLFFTCELYSRFLSISLSPSYTMLVLIVSYRNLLTSFVGFSYCTLLKKGCWTITT